MSVTDNDVPTDPSLAVAERQLAMLGELAQIAMELSRAHGASAMAAAHAVEVILADEYWQPETGRARALAGSKDAAEAFRKVSRSLRLTLALEMTTAERVRDLRAGVDRPLKRDDGVASALWLNPSEQSSRPDSRRGGASFSDDRALDRDERDSECLVEFDRPDRLPRGTFREIVETLCADLGVTPDWDDWRLDRPALKYRPLQPRPPGWSECRQPGADAILAAETEHSPQIPP